MAEIQEIDVQIDRDGTVRIEVRGVNGAKCEDITREIEAVLGGRVTGREHKPSYHVAATSEAARAKVRLQDG